MVMNDKALVGSVNSGVDQFRGFNNVLVTLRDAGGRNSGLTTFSFP